MWVAAPPSSSKVTSSPVTVLITSGPVMNMWLVPSTIRVKSVIAGEYTAPPAAGPMIRLICGMTPGGAGVAEEDLREQPERDHAFLDPGAAAVVDPDDRAADLHGVVHDLDDLLPVDLPERPAEHGEVLGVDRDRAPVDQAGAR